MGNRYKQGCSLIILTGVAFLLLFMQLAEAVTFASKKSSFTEVKGVVVYKYYKSKGYGRHRRGKYYLDVRYTDNQEEKIAEGLEASFWETTGSTIKFYLTPNGKAVRSVVINSEVIYPVLMIGYSIIFVVKKRRKIRPYAAMTKGTVINEYDFILDEENTKEDNIAGQNMVSEVNQGAQAEPGPLKMPSAKPSFELYTEEEYRNRK